MQIIFVNFIKPISSLLPFPSSLARLEEYLRKEKSESALRIQTLWRGHRERTKLSARQEVALKVKAAIRIQRFVSGPCLNCVCVFER